MKNKINVMNIIYWFFRIGFVLQVLMVLSLIYFSFFFSKDHTLAINAYSELRILPGLNPYSPVELRNLGSSVETKIFQLPQARSNVVFHSLSEIGLNGYLVIGLNLLNYSVWLLFTWLLLKVLQSMKQHETFKAENIIRLRIVALIVGLSPFILLTRNIVDIDLIQDSAVLVNHRIAYFYDYSLFAGFFYMVLIFLLIEIFKYGISLKVENDLTV
jgi:hypothetical protein